MMVDEKRGLGKLVGCAEGGTGVTEEVVVVVGWRGSTG